MPLIGNYEHSLDSISPEYRDLSPPILSNLTLWDTGTHGSMGGTYAFKLATRPTSGRLAIGIKRHTFRQLSKIQLECYFTFKPEASTLLGEMDIEQRYLNALDSERVARWQTKPQTRAFEMIGDTGKTVSHYHLGAEGWVDVPPDPQPLCYNEIAIKMNWHYLRVGLDLRKRAFLYLDSVLLSTDTA